MNKETYIDALERKLWDRLDPDQLRDIISYYRDYFAMEAAKGISEEETIQKLGDPALLAKSILAAEGSKAPSTVPVWLCIPFAGLLLCIAVMPLVKAEWWESHQPLVVALWIILMVVPFAFVYGAGKTAETVLDCIVNDYLTSVSYTHLTLPTILRV